MTSQTRRTLVPQLCLMSIRSHLHNLATFLLSTPMQSARTDYVGGITLIFLVVWNVREQKVLRTFCGASRSNK